MIRDITIGQYYPADSVIHRLDPRVKLLGTLLYIIAIFFAKDLIGYVAAFLFLAIVIALSKVPTKFIFRGLKPLLFILILSVSFNIFLTPGKVLLQFWIFRITREGLLLAFYMALRLIFLVIGSSIMTLTTTPNQLTDGLESGLSWLKIFRVPVHEAAMMMSIALRYIPILIEETDKIMKAQMARGADFETGRLIQRVKNMIPLLVPLFLSAFRRGRDLAFAMEARCYHGGKGRTKMKPLRHKGRDYVALFLLLLYFVGMILLNLFAPRIGGI